MSDIKDGKTEDQLVRENMGLVYKCVGRWCRNQDLDQDLIQMGLMGLLDAIRQHDPSKSRFSTFALRCINNRIIDEMRKEKRHSREVPSEHTWAMGFYCMEDSPLVDDIERNIRTSLVLMVKRGMITGAERAIIEMVCGLGVHRFPLTWMDAGILIAMPWAAVKASARRSVIRMERGSGTIRADLIAARIRKKIRALSILES